MPWPLLVLKGKEGWSLQPREAAHREGHLVGAVGFSRVKQPTSPAGTKPQQNQDPWFAKENLFTSILLVIANTLFQQPTRRLYMWTSPDGQHRNQIDYILCSQRWRSSVQSAKTRLGTDCGSDHEFLIAKFRLKLKKVGKTTRPFIV